MAPASSHEEPWRLTASEVLPLLQSNKLTVTDYVKSLLERIQKRDGSVKAWVYLSPSLILQRAKELDDLPASKRGPLFGLPVAVKDVVLTKDMPTQYNSKLYETEDPITIDANVILTLRASGALIFGKTATTEFASSKQGNWHQNLTKNAWDAARTPGGSSSGSGAAVGDYQVPVAIGTQTGGSVMRPASFNGCYGYKPTKGAISREGLAQWSPEFDTTGFFSRSIDDFGLLANVFALKDDEPVSEKPYELKGAKIAICRTHNWPNSGPGTRHAMEKAESLLLQHGANVEHLDLPDDFGKMLDWHATVLSGEGQSSFLGQHLTLQSQPHKLHESIQSYVRNEKNYTRKQLAEAYDGMARLRPVWDELADKYDVVLTPSVVDEAPEGLENTGDMSFCSMWTALHVPCVGLVGFAGSNGLPIGLTAVAGRYQDRHLLHACKTLGRAFEEEGGWTMTPP